MGRWVTSAGVHFVNFAAFWVVKLTKRTAWVRNVNGTGEIGVRLTKCTLTAARAPHLPTQPQLTFSPASPRRAARGR